MECGRKPGTLRKPSRCWDNMQTPHTKSHSVCFEPVTFLLWNTIHRATAHISSKHAIMDCVWVRFVLGRHMIETRDLHSPFVHPRSLPFATNRSRNILSNVLSAAVCSHVPVAEVSGSAANKQCCFGISVATLCLIVIMFQTRLKRV